MVDRKPGECPVASIIACFVGPARAWSCKLKTCRCSCRECGNRPEERLDELKSKLQRYTSSLEMHMGEYNMFFASKVQAYTSELEDKLAWHEGSMAGY